MNKIKRYVTRKQFFLIDIPLLLFVLYLTVFPYKDREVYLPGGVNEIQDVVTLENEYEREGAFYSSYVLTIPKPSRIVYWFSMTFLNGESVRLSQTEQSVSVSDLNAQSRVSKKNSIFASLLVAYNAAERPFVYESDGVTIAFRYPEFPSYKHIEIEDRIIEINGHPIKNTDELAEEMVKNTSCGEVELVVIRNGKEKKIKTTSVTNEGKCTLGIQIVNHYNISSSEPEIININSSGYGGSAGLMQTLMIYNKLIETDITNGLKISGTGGINAKGEVTAIAGIKQKVMGAIKDNIDVYFAPDLTTSEGNLYEEALKIKKKMKSNMIIIPVKHFNDAIDYLNEFKENEK